jgi:acyl dehydratase
MTSTSTNGLVTDMAGLRESAGRHIGYTNWQEMTQERVNQAADATDDHQFIPMDVERARARLPGSTVTHGYLTVSLMAAIMIQLLNVAGAKIVLNDGLGRVPFGLRFRSAATAPRS